METDIPAMEDVKPWTRLPRTSRYHHRLTWSVSDRSRLTNLPEATCVEEPNVRAAPNQPLEDLMLSPLDDLVL
jgi:hypothetical protein